ncbi:MAG TPA: Nramp family divalent metal transporter [Actinomycetota bacterium]|nr:Nramp family divalent metal transporter [Actinomycetota bacterium]
MSRASKELQRSGPPLPETASEEGTRHPALQVAARKAISGRSRGLIAVLPFMGPAFIASIAYVDPGNFATNVSAGARFGYDLLWVILVANLMAMLLQTLAAKLGIATGKNLAELCRDRYPVGVCRFFWVTQEITAMATDLAEFLGAAIGINLLFHIPLFGAALITGVGVCLILALQGKGFRGLEAFIGGCAIVIAICYVVETVLARPSWSRVATHTIVPSLPHGAALLAVGIVGATVMPHVIYLHSHLTQGRVVGSDAAERRRIFQFERIDVLLAMGLAGLVNLAMLFMAAKVFHFTGHTHVGDISTAFHTLTPLLGGGAALVFGVSLIASGIASSHVGTMAGQVVMQGFIGYRIPVFWRRALTMVPALVAIYLKLNPTTTLVLSQVVLSFTLPIPVITLIAFTRDRHTMGDLVNHPMTTVLGWACAALIVVLNAVLLVQSLAG